MFKLPNGWEQKNLGELAAPTPNSFVDGPFGSNLKTDEYTSEGVRLIQLQNIGEGVWLDENQKFISHRKLNHLSRHTAYPGEIAIAKMADPVARACILPGVSEKFVVVADCIKLTPDYTQYDSRYLVYAINHQNVRVQAEQKSIGTTRKRINLSVLKTLKIWIPPISEQQCIAEILDTIDEAIAHTSSIIAKLKQIKAGLLHDLLTRGLDENGELRDAIAHPEQFKDSPIGRIPKDWSITNIGEIARVRRGASPRPIDSPEWFANEGFGWVRITDVTRSNGHLYRTEQYLSSRGVLRSVPVKPGQLIMSICATIGEPAIVEINVCIHDGFVVFDQYQKKLNTKFLRNVECRYKTLHS
ncbi:restriction endonuclease subunit S [Umezakia ovalisporum]|uniref:restriction endonuclease subunit S n=1 Tax=Umezakia ovalisporum TaxID=75695 RepID=UPI0035B73B65